MTQTGVICIMIYFINLPNLLSVECDSKGVTPGYLADIFIEEEPDKNNREVTLNEGRIVKERYHEDSLFQPPNNKLMINYLELPVDHFGDEITDTWNMTCVQNSEFWKPKAPVYLFVRGNTPMTYNELKEGLMYELAKETGGVMFSTKHRYYGKTDPHRDFAYLTSEQAIEDLYFLLGRIKNETDYFDSKIVIIGGGYGGSLAVWLKQAHPDAADVVIASGAPLLAKVNFKEYFMHSANDYKIVMPAECSTNMRDQLYIYYYCLSRADFRECVKNNFTFFDVCYSANMRIPENKQLFYLSEMSIYSEAAERGIKYMSKVCENLKTSTRIREASAFWDEQNSCYDFDFGRFIITVNENPAFKNIKRWFYQCCNEFGFFPTTAGYPFPLSSHIPIEFYYKICSELFGPEFNEYTINEKVEHTNRRYGGLKPNVTNVIFVFGDLDPWLALGVVESLYNKNRAVLIRGVSHFKDLEPSHISDKTVLGGARKRIKNLVKDMLSDHSVTDDGYNTLQVFGAFDRSKFKA